MKNDAFTPENNSETLVVSRAEYDRLHAEIVELKGQVELLTEALRLAQHKRFGVSSEKSAEAVSVITAMPVKAAKRRKKQLRS